MECEEDDTVIEALAQCKHENKKLREEINSLKRTILSYEEHINVMSVDLSKKECGLKKYEKQISSLLETIEEKDQIFDVMDRKLRETTELNEKLENTIALLKDETSQQADSWSYHEKEYIEKYERETSELKRTVNSLSEENTSNVTLVNDLCRQIKALEDENATLQERIELLVIDDCDKCSPLRKSPSTFKNFPHNISPVRRHLDFSPPIDGNANLVGNNVNHFNLREELLLAELNEKENTIKTLNDKLSGIDGMVYHRSRLIYEYLTKAIDILSVSREIGVESMEFFMSSSKSVLQTLLKELENWSEGQAVENNPLTEGPKLVAVKETVINAQPTNNRIVELVSIATQTDKILLAKAFEEFNPVHNVSEYKYSDVDMDLYRSYRKLSILPEEEDDDSLKRIPSIKNAFTSKSFSAKLSHSNKTQSADNLLHFKNEINKHVSSEKLVSSCGDIIVSELKSDRDVPSEPNEFFHGLPEPKIICDTKLSDTDIFKCEMKPIDTFNENHTTRLYPIEAFRHPGSFDSYLNSQNTQSPLLHRQISDPVEIKTCDPLLSRRGSHMKRPRSTCRPLRLPCNGNGKKREERVSKVRFDLSHNDSSKPDEGNMNICKDPVPVSNLKNHCKVERVSRFIVVRVDEDEFRRSIDEPNKSDNPKRPPVIHSVMYKKPIIHDMIGYESNNSVISSDSLTSRVTATGSPDSPSYDTATENSPVNSFDMTALESYETSDAFVSKRRKQSDSSNYSVESQESTEDNNILVKSIRLHTNSGYITMKELDRDSSNSSHLSMDLDIPYIDAEELPVVKPSPEIIKSNYINENTVADESPGEVGESIKKLVNSEVKQNESLVSQSESCETFITACGEVTPVLEYPDSFLFPVKTTGLSKSPTVLKNLANFEIYNTVSQSVTALQRGHSTVCSEVMIEEDLEDIIEDEKQVREDKNEENDECYRGMGEYPNEEGEEVDEEESTILKLTSSDNSEMSDTVTYVTVKSEPSNALLSSDYDSDTYVTIQSDRSGLERKFSDFSENSSSPYNTPPDTSSASFCTPPDRYSPVLRRFAKHVGTVFESSRIQTSNFFAQANNPERGRSDEGSEKYMPLSVDPLPKYDTPPNSSPFGSPTSTSSFKRIHTSVIREDSTESESVTIYNIDDSNFPSEWVDVRDRKELIMFESPKLEFYETNDSIENLETFLKAEEGLQEPANWLRRSSDTDVYDEHRKNSDAEDGPMQNMESSYGCGDSKFFEKRNKRHPPPLSRQNSTEDYNFLDPHDSCLNLSEEISSPSTTPDTSNKTVIFKNKPLTVSNTIDLDDDDFPISEAEIQINFNGSETEIVEIAIGDGSTDNERHDIYSCRSEPCIPSISSSSDPPTVSRLPKQSSSMTEDEHVVPQIGKSDPNLLPMPEIIVSNLSSESENDSDDPGGVLVDFASNASDRSDIHLSDLYSVSGHSDAASSNSDPSDIALSERSAELQSTDPDLSVSVSPEISECSSSSSHPGHSADNGNYTNEQSVSVVKDANTEPEMDDIELSINVPESLTNLSVGRLAVIDLTDEPSHDIRSCKASARTKCAYYIPLLFENTNFMFSYASLLFF